MSMNDISGKVFDNLQTYAGVTATGADDKSLEALNQLILDAVAGADPPVNARQVGEKIDELRKQNPNWTMDQVFEAAVKSLNPACSDSVVNEIRNAWQEFTGISDLSRDDISDILESPATFAINHSDSTMVSLRNAIELLIMLLLQIAAEESGDMLEQGVTEMNFTEAAGKKKADAIITKGWLDGAMEITSAVMLGMGSLASGAFNLGALGKSSNMALSQALGNLGQVTSSLFQSLGSLCTGGGRIGSSYAEANIARQDTQMQLSGIRREALEQLKQDAHKVIEAGMSLLKLLGQSDYQVMTTIGKA